MLYLDVLASYPRLVESQDALISACQKHIANPSANHILGELAYIDIEEARKVIADSIEALPSEIVFTSGATESNNLVLKGVVIPLLSAGKTPHIITSAIEHKCILAICAYLEELGCEVTYLPPSSDGLISAKSIQKAMQPNTALVSVMHVNNELGTVNDIKSIGKVCFENGVKFHTDAAQSYLKTTIDVDEQNIDYLSLSAHKIGGPKGIGAAYIRDLRSHHIQPLIHGAGQEHGVRGGTLATPLIVAFRAAVEHFPSHYNAQHLESCKQLLLGELLKQGIHFQINGGKETLPLMVNISLLNVDVPALIRGTTNKYTFSQGSACSSGSIEPSHVLLALSLNRELASNTLRISFSSAIQKSQLTELVNDIFRFRMD